MILLFGILIFLAIVVPLGIYALAELGDAFSEKY